MATMGECGRHYPSFNLFCYPMLSTTEGASCIHLAKQHWLKQVGTWPSCKRQLRRSLVVEEQVGANISKGRNRRNRKTYRVGQLAIVTGMSWSHIKADCNDDSIGVGWGEMWETGTEREAVMETEVWSFNIVGEGWGERQEMETEWEAAREMEVWSMGCRKEHNQMEICGSREAMECKGGKDMDGAP
jgi:hypothetical protein